MQELWTMKFYKTILIVSFLFIWLFSNAQTVEKGSMYLGLTGSGYNSDYFDQWGILVASRFEYLARRKLGLGVDLGYSYDDGSKYLITNFFTRYYFLNRKFAPIIDANYLHGFSFQESGDLNLLYLNVGIATPRLLFNRVGFDLTYGIKIYQSSETEKLSYTLSGIRITYSINNK